MIKNLLPGFVHTAIFRQCILSICISQSYFCIGLLRGYSAPAFPSILKERPELLPNPNIQSWAGSIPPAGAFMGSILAGPLMHYIGRKYTVVLTSPLWVVAWSIIATTNNWKYLVLGRFLSGIGAGITLPSAQIYVSECTDSQVRGIIGSFPSISMSAGILFTYIFGDLFKWNVLAWINCGISFFIVCTVTFLPESPVWLNYNKQFTKAKQSREWLMLETINSNKKISNVTVISSDGSLKSQQQQQQLAIDVDRVEPEKDSWRVLLTRPILMPMTIGLTLLLIQQVSGVDAVIFFTVDIFRTSGSSIDDNLATIIVGFVQLASNFLSLFVVDRSGRKPLLIISGVIMSISMAFMGIAFHLHSIGNNSFGLVPLISLITFMIGFSLGFGSIPFLLMGEIFPAQQRGLLSSIAISFNVAAMFTVVKTYHDLESLITPAGTFWMYSIFCAAGVVFVIFCVPETKGRELDNMAKVFRKSFRIINTKFRKPKKTSTIECNLPAIPETTCTIQNSDTQQNTQHEQGDSNKIIIVESTKC